MLKGLKFKASAIAKYERENKTNVAQLIGDILAGVDSLANAISIGLGVSKDKAFDFIDAELEEGRDLEDVQQDVLDALAKAGFMREVIKRINVKQLIASQIEPAMKQMGMVQPQTPEVEAEVVTEVETEGITG